MADQQPTISEAEAAEWVRAQYQAAAKYIAEEGYIPDVVHLQESRYLAPHVAVWRFTTMDKKTMWVINGDVPTDMVAAKVADDARSVMRHFALQWQLKAQAIQDKAKGNDDERQYANYLIGRAETVYQATEHHSLWQQS